MPAAAVCPECNGTGWKIVEREEVSGAVRCDCVAAERADACHAECGYPPLYANASFDNFLLPRDNPIAYRELTEVFLAVRGLCARFPQPKKPGLLLMGDPAPARPTWRWRPSAPSWRRASKGCSSITRICSTASAPATIRILEFQRQRGLPGRHGYRGPAAGRSGRAPRDRLGGRHRDLDHHIPLQPPEAADRDHQSDRSRCRLRHLRKTGSARSITGRR